VRRKERDIGTLRLGGGAERKAWGGRKSVERQVWEKGEEVWVQPVPRGKGGATRDL